MSKNIFDDVKNKYEAYSKSEVDALLAPNDAKGTSIRCGLTPLSSDLAPGDWRPVSSGVTKEVPAGAYLAIISCTIVPKANNNGIATAELYLDTARFGGYSRNTVPLQSGLHSTTASSILLFWNETGNHFFNIYVYPSVTCNVTYCNIDLIKIK